MTMKLILTISLLFFINCGGSSSNNTNSKLEGTWILKDGCISHGESSDFIRQTFRGVDLTVIFKSYNNRTCTEANLTNHSITKSEELIGEIVIAKDAQSAISLDSTITDIEDILSSPDDLISFGQFIFEPSEPILGIKSYKMYRINEQGELQFSNSTVENNGSNSENRMNDFSNSRIYVRE